MTSHIWSQPMRLQNWLSRPVSNSGGEITPGNIILALHPASLFHPTTIKNQAWCLQAPTLKVLQLTPAEIWFYVLATSTVISGRVSTCHSAHSWWLYSAAPMGNQTTGTMIQYPTQLHYPDTELTSPCLILLIPTAILGSDKYKFDKSLVWLDREPKRFGHSALLMSYVISDGNILLICCFTP